MVGTEPSGKLTNAPKYLYRITVEEKNFQVRKETLRPLPEKQPSWEQKYDRQIPKNNGPASDNTDNISVKEGGTGGYKNSLGKNEK